MPFRFVLIACAGLASITVLSVSAIAPAHANDDDSISCLALTIYHEARGEPRLGQLAVGHVVMNRARSGVFPTSVCAVVEQGGERLHECQFSWWCDGRSDQPRDMDALRRSFLLAKAIYDGCTDDPTRGALWFHVIGLRPAWSKSVGLGKRIGDHVFYRGKPNDIARAGKLVAAAAPTRVEKSCHVEDAELHSIERPSDEARIAPGA